jgi:hypothetical protein
MPVSLFGQLVRDRAQNRVRAVRHSNAPSGGQVLGSLRSSKEASVSRLGCAHFMMIHGGSGAEEARRCNWYPRHNRSIELSRRHSATVLPVIAQNPRCLLTARSAAGAVARRAGRRTTSHPGDPDQRRAE